MDPLLDFTGKVVLITGAAQGFGKLLAESFADRGAKLVIGDINKTGVEEVAKQLRSTGKEVVAIACDVSKEAQCKAMVDSAVEHYGQLDIAVNNAGIAPDLVLTHETDEAVLDLQFNVNVKGVHFGMKHQITQMLKQAEGSILNISSLAGLGGAPKISSYSAAKHAVIGLTKTAAVEYGRKNIRVNAICPFFTATNMVTELMSADSVESLSQGAPMKRIGKPEEIVAMMLMVLSPANSYMTGQCIAIDGGVSAS